LCHVLTNKYLREDEFMDVALNLVAQLGGFLQKEVKPETGATAPERRGEGYEGAAKQDGAAKEFLAALLGQSAATKNEAEEFVLTPDDPGSLAVKVQFESPAALTVDDAGNKLGQSQPGTSALLIIGGREGVPYELQDQAPVSNIRSFAEYEPVRLQPGPLATLETEDDTSERQSRETAPAVIGGADIEVLGPQASASVPSASGDVKSKPGEPNSRASTPAVVGGAENEVLGPQASAYAPSASGDVKSKPNEPQSRAPAPIIAGEAETIAYRQQPRTTIPVVLGSTENGALLIGVNGQTERAQSIGLTVTNRSTTDDPINPRRPSLPGAKAAIVQGVEISSPQKVQSTSLDGVQQLAPSDAERAVAEDIRIPEKQTQPSVTLNDPSRVVQARQTTPYFPVPADHAVSSALIAKSGEGVSSDLDLDMAVDFTSGRRLVGQAVSAPQALASPTTTHAPVVGATAQIIAAIKANRRSDTIEIRLDPPELGRVKIDFTMETMDSVKAILSAERAETLDHMRRNIGELAAQLKDAGFKSMEFEFAKNSGHEFSKTNTAPETSNNDGGDAPSLGQEDIVYLSMRSDAQLDLLA
jgi:Flagellar hook-length control protein FliK